MRPVRSLLLALTVVALSLPAGAQQPAPATQAPRAEPFARLLERREALGLSDAQVSRLEAVRDRLRTRNEPLGQRIQAARRQAGLPARGARPGRGDRPRLTEEQRAARRRVRDEARPLMEQMRENRRAAMEEVRAVLTEEQLGRLRRLHQAEAGRHGGRSHRPRRGMRHHHPAPAPAPGS